MSDTNDVLEAFEQYAGQPEAMIHWDDDSNQYLPNTSLEGDGHQLHSMAKRAAYFFTQRLEDFAGGYRWQSQKAQGEGRAMFSTKKCAENWIRDYGQGRGFTVKRWGRHWAVYDGPFRAQEEELHDIEEEHDLRECEAIEKDADHE